MSLPINEAPRGDTWLAERASALSDELHRALAAVADDTCWLVYDPALHPLAEDDEAAQWAKPEHSPMAVPIDHPQVDRSLWPLWMPLDAATGHGSGVLQASLHAALAELQPEALQHGHGRRIAGWLQLHDDCDPARAARQLGRAMLQCPPGGGGTLVRLHDPAVRWALWPLLDAGQQAALLGQIRCWWGLDPTGHLCRIESAQPTSDALTLRVDQWRDLELIRPLNRALAHWLPDQPAAWRAPHPVEQARDLALQALRRAHLHGLDDPHDLAAFAGHALCVHPRFDEHPRMRSLLKQRQASGEHYAAAVEALTDDDWSAIAQDLNR